MVVRLVVGRPHQQDRSWLIACRGPVDIRPQNRSVSGRHFDVIVTSKPADAVRPPSRLGGLPPGAPTRPDLPRGLSTINHRPESFGRRRVRVCRDCPRGRRGGAGPLEYAPYRLTLPDSGHRRHSHVPVHLRLSRPARTCRPPQAPPSHDTSQHSVARILRRSASSARTPRMDSVATAAPSSSRGTR